MIDLQAVSGLNLRLDPEHLLLDFGSGIGHPDPEIRTLDQVRPMLDDPNAAGPQQLYSIYMDIYRQEDYPLLLEADLLYGSVIYNSGILGREVLRSQGHLHSEKPGTGLRYSEVYEFWTGRGFVYLQKEAGPIVTRAYLVQVTAGDKLVIPFGWVHLVVTSGSDVLSFGAWCARRNTFEYASLRALGGPAYYFLADGSLEINPHYSLVSPIIHATASDLPSLGIPTNQPIYSSWRENPNLYDFMANPEHLGDIWTGL